jgi:hypothetical protein
MLPPSRVRHTNSRAACRRKASGTGASNRVHPRVTTSTARNGPRGNWNNTGTGSFATRAPSVPNGGSGTPRFPCG